MSGTARQRVVLVTGASRGIGLAVARTLLETQFRLVLTAREASLPRFAELGITESPQCLLRPLDVTQPGQADTLVAEIDRLWGGVDVLVNNAGICYRSVIEHLDDVDENHQMHVNYFGPMHLIRLVLPGMRQRRTGHIINLSSVGGMMAMPTMGAYSASKFALEGASEALWYEMRPWGIQVTLIEPGFVDSDSFENAIFSKRGRHAMDHADDVYHQYYTNLIQLISKLMYSSPTRPEGIARSVLKVINQKRPPLRVLATWDALIFNVLRHLLPSRPYHWFLYRCLPNIRHWVPPKSEVPPKRER